MARIIPFLVVNNGLIFWHRRFYNRPTYQVGNRAKAEGDEIARRLAFESQEAHIGFPGVYE